MTEPAELSPELEAALEVLGAEWRTTREVFEQIRKKQRGLRLAAISERLAKLVKLGRCERRPSTNSRGFDYRQIQREVAS